MTDLLITVVCGKSQAGELMKTKNGLLFVLIECSQSMQQEMVIAQPSGVSQRIPRSELVVASVSRFLQNLARDADLGVIIGGYSLDQNGRVQLSSRSANAVSDFDVESLASIAASPLEVKSVTQNASTGLASQEIPVHLRLELRNGGASQAEAFAAAQRILLLLNPEVAMVINICCSESAGANPQQIVEQIIQLTSTKTQVINVHLGTGLDIAVKYPSQKLALRGIARQLFSRTSDVSPVLSKGLGDLKQVILKGAKALVVNASMVDLAELFAAVSAEIVGTWPDGLISAEKSNPKVAGGQGQESLPDEPTPVEVLPVAEKSGVNLLFVVRTAVEDPFSQESGDAVRKLLDVVNETIDSCHRLDASMSLVTMTKDRDGDVEVTAAFPGDKLLSSAIDALSIRESAVDIVEFTEAVSDGVGGLIDIPKKKHIFLRAEPGFACSFDDFLPEIKKSIQTRNVATQIVILFLAGPPTAEDLNAIESLKAECEFILIGFVWTISAHPPLSGPLKDTSGIQDLQLACLAEHCQISLNDETVLGLSVNSSRGVSKLLNEVAAIEF